MGSKIEWTEKTWNPVTGCTPISEGCANCYAKRLIETRLAHLQRYKNGFDVTVHEDKIDEPHRRKKPCRVFVCSMGDLFHANVPTDIITRIVGVMHYNLQHTFQVLTKRPESAYRFCHEVGILPSWPDAGLTSSGRTWPDNAWFGTSAESQECLDERIPWLLRHPAPVRFLSIEPLLGPINLGLLGVVPKSIVRDYVLFYEMIRWVIVGGESGPGARPCHVEWVRDIVSQCREAGVPVFVKQLGSNPWMDGKPIKLGFKGKDMDEWPEDLRVREYPS